MIVVNSREFNLLCLVDVVVFSYFCMMKKEVENKRDSIVESCH